MKSFGVLLAALTPALAAGIATGVHLRLTRSEPAKDTVIAKAPEELRLWFSEKPQVAVSAVALTGPDGAAKVSAARQGADSMSVEATVESPLVPGAYTVNWRTAGRDGHVLRGQFAFTIGAPGDQPQ